MAEDKKTTATEAEAVVKTDQKTPTQEAQSQNVSDAKKANHIEVNTPLEVKDLDKKWQKRVNAIFESDKKLEKLYVTSDEQLFADLTFAKPHAKRLEDTSIGVVLKS